MRVIGVDHTSFAVADLDRSLAFYVGLLGCDLLWRREIADGYFRRIVGLPDAVVRAAHLRIPGSAHTLELFEYATPRGQPADVQPNNPGSAHLAWLVDDLAAAYDELRAADVRFRAAPVVIDAGVNRGGLAAYALDPDGIVVELFQRPVGPAGAGER